MAASARVTLPVVSASRLPGWQCVVDENDEIQPGELELITALLANHGIEAQTANLGDFRNRYSRPTLWVPDADHERAVALLQNLRNEGQNPPRGFSWRCSGCMESNEPQFDVSWNCGRDKPLTKR